MALRSRPRRPRLVAATVAVAATAFAASCSSGTEPVTVTLPPRTSDSGTTASTSHMGGTTPRDPTGTATIESFEVRNQISCTGDVDVTTAVDYETTGAASVAVLVDGEQVPGSAPLAGTFDIPISCDGRSHTVVLVAVDDLGVTTVDSRVVLTSTTPLGN